MHKLKWVYDRNRVPEVGAVPQGVTSSNPRGAGRKPDGSRVAAQARGDATYWTPRLCHKEIPLTTSTACVNAGGRDRLRRAASSAASKRTASTGPITQRSGGKNTGLTASERKSGRWR